MRVRVFHSACGLAMAWAGTARAQGTPAGTCHGERVSAIHIESRAPSVSGVHDVPVMAGLARAVHVTTRPNVVQRILLLHVGDKCTELRRQESERVLRAQPFIADATVTAGPDGQGGVVLDVQTIDEVAAVLGLAARATGPFLTATRLGDANWGGEGVYGVANWRHEDVLRDEFGFRISDYQFLGRPYQATVLGTRDALGGEMHADIQRPFLTDLQRVAWRMQEGRNDDYVRFEDPAGDVHAMRLERNYADIGGVTRIGPPGHLALLGVSISHEGVRPGLMPLTLSDSGPQPDPGSPLDGRYQARAASRINALVGFRKLKYVRAEGLDGLRSVQDIPTGIEIGTLLGKSSPLLGSSAHDALVGGDLYVAHATPTSALWLQVTGEGRRDFDTDAWDGVLGSGSVALHRRMNETQTLVSSVEWSGGWRVGVPFRVTLADGDGGVRGMPYGTEQGARRAIARVEDRWTVGAPLSNFADLGFALFADAGWLWAGDAPYGTTTPARYSAGFSLLAAVPSRSAQMWRLDIAVPNVPGHGVQVAIRLSRSDWTTLFWREPDDVSQARERSVPVSMFAWP